MKILNLTPLKKSLVFFLIAVLLFHSSGCTYYQVKRLRVANEATINKIGKLHKHFVIHNKGQVFAFTGISVDSSAIHGYLNEYVYFHYPGDSSGRINRGEKDIVNEVHIYLHSEIEMPPVGEKSSISLSDIHEVRIIESDTGKDVAVFLVSAAGTVIALYALFVIIVLLFKSSCPYVYVDDGQGMVFEGETFGGAIGRNIERDDYMPLPSLKMKDGTYHLRITNELKERQYTDIAELMLVSHHEGEDVLLDKYGEPHLIGAVESFKEVQGIDHEDQVLSLRSKDYDKYLFNNTLSDDKGIVLTFDKSINSESGKLLLRANNSLWFDFLIGEVFEKMGSSFDLIMDRNASQPAEKIIKEIKGHEFPLSISVWKNNQWEFVDYINTVGPLASRDFVVPIDLSDIPSNEVKIKLETGFMFWELDYVGMDFSNLKKPQIKRVKPYSALGSGSINWSQKLSTVDGNYMSQESIGDITDIVYMVPPELQGKQQAVFLHTRGYYELIRDFEGLPKISELEKFKTPGYFSDYSKRRYLETLLVDEDCLLLANSN